MLKPIQVRKLIQHWKKCVVAGSEQSNDEVAPPPPPPRAVASTSASSSYTMATFNQNPLWETEYEVPWEKMSHHLLRGIKRRERIKPSLRRDMIRVIVDDARKICQRPGKKQLTRIAEKIVAKYPSSFKDVIEGHVVGTGYDSILKQLIARVENENRKIGDLSSNKAPNDGEPPAKKRLTDSYGCVNYDPKALPDDETEESLLLKKEEMKVAFNEGQECNADIIKLYYVLQRKDINGNMQVLDLQAEWPYLFVLSGMVVHFEELMGTNIRILLEDAYTTKGKRIISYLTSLGKPAFTKIALDMTEAKNVTGNNMPGMLMMVVKYFGEKMDNLFMLMDLITTKNDVEAIPLPSTPVIIACGDSLLTASNYMLVIDGHVVNETTISNFLNAMTMMFASYFCFNIQYPTDIAATMDFIQRCFLKINPDKGNKVQRQKNKRQYNIHPKVLTLINGVADFEWTE